jgi:hypothetical protein
VVLGISQYPPPPLIRLFLRHVPPFENVDHPQGAAHLRGAYCGKAGVDFRCLHSFDLDSALIPIAVIAIPTKPKIVPTIMKIPGADGLRFHDLKHSCVSNLVAQGYSLEMIQAYVGHSTPYMTQRYAHIANERLEEIADGLSGTIQAQLASNKETAQNAETGKC